MIDHFTRRAELFGAVLPPAPLDLPIGQTPGADRNAEREADQIRIFEFHARTLVTVVEKSINSGIEQLAIDLFGCRTHVVLAPGLRYADLKRRDRNWPDDVHIVLALLDRGGDRATDAEAVTAHDHQLALSAFVEISAVHGRGVFRPQLEDVSDFN